MNGKRGSPAKVSRPVLKGYFPRKRLFRLLDHARTNPAIWISGPPGSGKTTLVSNYIENRKIPCLWYQVDEGDADIASFFYYLGIAGRMAAPRRKKPLPLLTPEHLPGLSVFTKRFFEDLFGRLKAPFLLVLDDCQKAQSDSLFFGTVREGLSRLPAGMNAILLSRSDPHPVFARKRAHGLLEVLAWKDLRLTLEEAEGVARMRWKSGRPDRRIVRDLHGISDGWAAGLVLLMERTGTDGPQRIKPRDRSAGEVFDYFAGEIFGKLDEEKKEFLRRSAFLPIMTAGMAQAVTGNGEAPRILSFLVRHNYFTQQHSGEEPVFEYHALFREFLLARAREAYPEDVLTKCLREAAGVLLEGGQVEAAVEVMREAHDVEALVRVIVTHAPSLLAKGRFRTLLGWLDALPKETVENEPWLLYWDGICRMPFAPGQSRVCFEKAFRKFDGLRDAPGAFLAWSGVVHSVLFEGTDYKQLDAWISNLQSLLERYGGLPAGDIGDMVACRMFNALVFRRPEDTDADLWADRVLAVGRETQDLRLKIDSIIFSFLHKLGKGGFQDAESGLACLRELLRRPDATPVMRLQVDWMEGLLSLFVAEHHRCMGVVSAALAFAADTGIHFLDLPIVLFGAIASLHLGDFETANTFIRKMAAAVGDICTVASSQYHLVAACEALGGGGLRKAAYHSRENVKQLEESGNVGVLPTAYVLAAHIRHEFHDHAEAARHLAQARRIGSEFDSPQALWQCALSEAYFHLDRGREAEANAALREGLPIGREHGLFGTFFWRPGFLEKVASKGLEEGIEVDYVRELIRRNRLVPDSGQPALEQWPWPVKVYTLGRFGLLREEKPVEFPRKVQQKPLKLLKALIALGGRDVAREQLIDVLWPEADGDLAQQSFTAALHRLRQLLGEEKALELKEGRLSLSARHCWVDAWAFERLAGEALDPGGGRRGDAVGERSGRLLEKALAMYRGQFLAGEPEEPHLVSMRERLRGRFLRAVAELGRRHEEAGRWEEAASWYTKGLDADDLAEELYRRLMACHIRQGHDAEALSVYRRCRKVLSGVLGVEPSPATVALSKSIGCVTV